MRMEDMFQRGDGGARRSSVGQTAVKAKWSYHLTRGSGGDFQYDSTHRGAELREPGTDAVIITWETMVRVALEAAQLESEGLWTYILL